MRELGVTPAGLRGRLLFTDPHTGKAYSRWNNNPWRKALVKAGFSIPFHGLRRTFASRLDMGRVSIRRIQKLLDHASEQQTWSYVCGDPEEIGTTYPTVGFTGARDVAVLDRYPAYDRLLFTPAHTLQIVPEDAPPHSVRNPVRKLGKQP
ncbi:MAG TPA: tyrosine-type recombinase/integrase [Planctomycetota bacterium]|nr:tyrosine-type recombinase/integrase [Planctomycetota bacterium]